MQDNVISRIFIAMVRENPVLGGWDLDFEEIKRLIEEEKRSIESRPHIGKLKPGGRVSILDKRLKPKFEPKSDPSKFGVRKIYMVPFLGYAFKTAVNWFRITTRLSQIQFQINHHRSIQMHLEEHFKHHRLMTRHLMLHNQKLEEHIKQLSRVTSAPGHAGLKGDELAPVTFGTDAEFMKKMRYEVPGAEVEIPC